MSVLSDLTAGIAAGSIEVVDLTAPLSSQTPILNLPEPLGQTWPFALEEISRYDERGPAWYWNNISTGEHTGTHFDAPIHWVTGPRGRRRLAGAAPAAGRARGRARRHRRGRRRTPTSSSRSSTSGRSRPQHGAAARRWLAADPHGLGRRAPAMPRRSPTRGTRRACPSSAPAGWPRRRRSRGSAWRRSVPTRAWPTRSTHRSPATRSCSASDKYGLTQLQNLVQAAGHRRGRHRRPAADRGRLGQPVPGAGARSSADAYRRRGGRPVAGRRTGSTTSSASWAAATSMSPTRSSPAAPGSSPPRTRPAPRAWPTRTARVSGRPSVLSVHQGPGVTNALTGITEAAKSRTPLLVLAPEATQPTSNFFVDLRGDGRLRRSRGTGGSPPSRMSPPRGTSRRPRRAATVVLGLPLDVQAQPAELPPPTPPEPAASEPPRRHRTRGRVGHGQPPRCSSPAGAPRPAGPPRARR